jgi:hypothetical protein
LVRLAGSLRHFTDQQGFDFRFVGTAPVFQLYQMPPFAVEEGDVVNFHVHRPMRDVGFIGRWRLELVLLRGAEEVEVLYERSFESSVQTVVPNMDLMHSGARRLPAGTYHFRLKATIDLGMVNEPEAQALQAQLLVFREDPGS